jgi:hypothetical protein
MGVGGAPRAVGDGCRVPFRGTEATPAAGHYARTWALTDSEFSFGLFMSR